MEPNLKTSPPDSSDARAAFRKPSNDASNRQYRRRTPVSGLSSYEGTSPQCDRSVSPVVSRDDLEKSVDTRLGRDGRELDRDSTRNRYSRNDDSYRCSDRQSSRSSHGYSRHEKHGNEDGKYARFSSCSDRESRMSTHSDHHRRYDGTGHRSRDKEKETPFLECHKYKDKDSSFDKVGSVRRHGNFIHEEMDRDRRWDRDGRDEKVDYRRSPRDKKGNYTSYEESRSHRNDSSSARERDTNKHHPKEGYRSGLEDSDGLKAFKKKGVNYGEGEANVEKDRFGRLGKEQLEEKSIFVSKNQESPAKKTKLFSLGKSSDYDKEGDEKQLSLEQAEKNVERVNIGQVHSSDVDITNDVNAAKVAAMKAAELVNRNLSGAGHSNMTTEQKKMLWGSKKSTPAEESGHRWDTALFGDRERQEKFNKLMSEVAWVPMANCRV